MTISENHSFWVKWACALAHGHFKTRYPSLKNYPLSEILDIECQHQLLVRYYSIISNFLFPSSSSQSELREPGKCKVYSGKRSFLNSLFSKKMFCCVCKERKQNFASLKVSPWRTWKTRLKQVLYLCIHMQQNSAACKNIPQNFSCLEPFLLSMINPV